MSSKPALDSPRIATLDAMRGIAIIAVMGFHYSPDLIPYGWLGVELFFVISGFVIFMTLDRCRSLLEFGWRRFIRLWPSYCLSFLLIFVILNAFPTPTYDRDWHDLLAALILWSPLVDATYVSGVYWSLVVECRFYVLAALIYYTLGRNKFRIGWLAILVLATIMHFVDWRTASHLFSAKFLPMFTFGLVFYRAWSGQTDGLDRVLFVTAFLAMWLIWLMPLDGARGGLVASIILTGIVILFAGFVKGWLTWIANKPLLFIGRISYALYLLHFEAVIAIVHKLETLGVPSHLAWGGAISGCTIVATVITLAFEEPIRRWVRARRPASLQPAPHMLGASRV